MWEFETDPEYQAKLDWADAFVTNEIEPLDFVIDDPRDIDDPVRKELIPPLQTEVKAQGLWACHLGPELGGQGYGHVKLALLNEHIGRSLIAPTIFGCQAPDANTSRILARFGSPEIKERYLRPLLAGDIYSCFAATEPQGGADPKVYTTSAYVDGDEWVVNGEKWFASGAENCAFFIVMAVSEPDNPPYQRLSMIIVPRETPGIEIVTSIGTGISSHGHHSHLRFSDVRVPRDSMLGNRGEAFVVMQARMGVARLSLATRSLGMMKLSLDMMCERANSRVTQGELLNKKQLVQEMVADSWVEYTQFRLLVLQTAWKLDKFNDDDKRVRADIAAVKATMPKVWHNIAARAAQVHGALGVSHAMPFAEQILRALGNGVADGPTEVHKVTLARQVLSHYPRAEGMFPSYYGPIREDAARKKYADVLARHGRT